MEDTQYKKTRQDYLMNLKPGDLIAFAVHFKDAIQDKILSGKVLDKGFEGVIVQTRLGSVYKVPFNDIAWVRIPGRKWPSGIYSALKQK